ncbi:PstS family phosphate ABC transporter substrate-binding protein [Streptomyces sp. TLI_171]|uniref:PstS family phosphate ABC transporter substrate-binding protein n=1 Tax=Streptomyces sp. TLI_171 TaxID=1938859 RepID=UPI000C18FABF|nr:substrate-binding domain-containing protein [Streptomyces sp. TLI_171]RKE17738.1 ABC-type phosphate transport system substrate-binding protein [Streptomyces sp. TLI_171]
MRHTAAKAFAAVAMTAALSTVAAPAMADPSTLPTLPAAQDIVGAGSDTTQALLNQFSADYNASLGAGSTLPHLYSWDATGTSPITPKTGGSSITRPNGSGAGISALNANTSATLDFARSSRAPQTGDLTSDLFVAFAKDAVTWSAKATGGHAPANLTTQNLFDIYSCKVGATDWSAFGGTAGTIKPYLPQAQSGTRAFFLKAIGNPVLGGCVVTGPEENEGTDAALNDVNVIFPYSVGHWVGQANGHTTATDNKGDLTLRSINGVAPLTGTGTLSATFAAGTYGRVLYNVVRDTEWTATTTQGTALRAIFGTSGWICSTAGKADTSSYGYLTLPAAACGSTTHI